MKYEFAAGALAALLIVCFPNAGVHAADPPTLAPGSPAPDFELPGIDGRQHRLSDFAAADVFVVVFTCNHCPTAQAYESRIQRLHEQYSPRNVALVAISPNDPRSVRLDELGYTDMNDTLEEMKIRARQRGFSFPYLYDGDEQKAARAFGPVATPHVFVFDKDRKLHYAGRVDDSEDPKAVTTNDTRDAIESLLARRPVKAPTTKTFGCSIKWADKRDSARAAAERWDREEVSLESIDENGIRALLKNDTDKVRVINVWATWCGPCVAEFPELVATHRMYRGRAFEFVTISADSPEKSAEALAFLRRQHASGRNFIFGLNNKYKLIDAVDKEWAGALPYTVVVEPGGRILYRQMGELVPLELRRAVVDRLGRYYFQ